MNPDFWNILHDGVITHVSGSVPGDVRIGVEIDYLRERFAEPGDQVVLTLLGCTALSYHPFEDPPVAGFTDLVAARPEILRAKDWTDASIVECNNGDLRVTAADAALALDSGREISLAELQAVAEAYWTEWSSRSKPTGN